MRPPIVAPPGRAAHALDARRRARRAAARAHSRSSVRRRRRRSAVRSAWPRTRPSARCSRWNRTGSSCAASFTPAPDGVEWCDRRLLARIHRLTLNRLRAEIEPVTPADFMRFLFAWQHVAPEHRVTGPDGLRAVLEQLDGYELAAGAWERHVLPARVRGLRARPRSTGCASPASSRGGASRAGPHPAGSGRPRARSARRRSRCACASTSTPGGRSRRPPTRRRRAMPRFSADATRILDRLRQRGASFVPELMSALSLSADDVQRALGELVAAGAVTSDGFAGLRAMFVRRQDAVVRTGGFVSRRSFVSAAAAGGRWSLLGGQGDAGVSREAAVELYARTLLAALRHRVPAAADARRPGRLVARGRRRASAARGARRDPRRPVRARHVGRAVRAARGDRAGARDPPDAGVRRARDDQRRRSAEPGRHRHRRRSRRAPSRARAWPGATACRSRCWKATTSASCTTTSRRRRGRSPARSPDVVRPPSSAASSARADSHDARLRAAISVASSSGKNDSMRSSWTRDVLRCAEDGHRREEAEHLFAMAEGDRDDGDERRVEVRRPQARRDAGVVEDFREQRTPGVVQRAAERFAVHALDQRMGHRAPSSRPRAAAPSGWNIMRSTLPAPWRRRPVEQQREEARRRAVGLHDVPVPVQHDGRDTARAAAAWRRGPPAPAREPGRRAWTRGTPARSRRRAASRSARAAARASASASSSTISRLGFGAAGFQEAEVTRRDARPRAPARAGSGSGLDASAAAARRAAGRWLVRSAWPCPPLSRPHSAQCLASALLLHHVVVERRATRPGTRRGPSAG